MKTLIVYHSYHHKNTQQVLLKAKDVLDFDLRTVDEAGSYEGYELVGFASGIFAFQYHGKLFSYLKAHPLPEGMDFFLLHTAGSLKPERYEAAFLKKSGLPKSRLKGSLGVLGWDSFGPLALVGGIHKDRPNAEDIRLVIDYLKSLGVAPCG